MDLGEYSLNALHKNLIKNDLENYIKNQENNTTTRVIDRPSRLATKKAILFLRVCL